mgnify:CR=1 FL=1
MRNEVNLCCCPGFRKTKAVVLGVQHDEFCVISFVGCDPWGNACGKEEKPEGKIKHDNAKEDRVPMREFLLKPFFNLLHDAYYGEAIFFVKDESVKFIKIFS